MDEVGVISYCDLTGNVRIEFSEGGYVISPGNISEFVENCSLNIPVKLNCSKDVTSLSGNIQTQHLFCPISRTMTKIFPMCQNYWLKTQMYILIFLPGLMNWADSHILPGVLHKASGQNYLWHRYACKYWKFSWNVPYVFQIPWNLGWILLFNWLWRDIWQSTLAD